MGFTYYYNINNKIEKVSALNKLVNDSTASTEDKTKLIEIRKEVLNRKSIPEEIGDHVYSFVTTSLRSQKGTQPTAVANNSKNELLFLISTSGLYVASIMFLIPFGLINLASTKLRDRFNFFMGLAGVVLLLCIITLFGNFLLGFIPQIGHGWGWNYGLNALIQFSVFSFFIGAFIKLAKSS